jgi:hypothetical protein
MKPVNGTDLVRRINEVVTAWAQEQDFRIGHDGALVTFREPLVDENRGVEVTIRYPFVIGRPLYEKHT